MLSYVNLSMKSIILTFCTLLLSGFLSFAEVRYHCDSDKEAVKSLLEKTKGETFGDRVVSAAKALQGIPLAPSADNDSIGTLMIRLDSLSQREFIYVALAAAKSAGMTVPTPRDFEKNLENISRRKGVDEGFPSQFLYGSDWIVDNIYRGNLSEMTEYLTGGGYRTKTLDYVSRHPEQFPAMSNPEVVDKVKVTEFGYRSHRIPHLKKQSIGNKAVKELIQNGDIIILGPPEDDFDIYDIGIVSIEGGEPTLIHISRQNGVVSLDPYPLTRLFKIEGQHFYGYRWLRPQE